MLSKNKNTDYIIFDFLDNKDLLSLMSVNKNFHKNDDYFKHRLFRIFDLGMTLTKPEDKTFRQWWKLLVMNELSFNGPHKILIFAVDNDFMALFEYVLSFLCRQRFGYVEALTKTYTKILKKHLSIIQFHIDELLVKTSEYGRLTMTKLLIESGANVKYMYSCCLRKACRAGHFELVKHLVDSGANIYEYNQEALKSALLSGNMDLVWYLLDKGLKFTSIMLEILVDIKQKDVINNLNLVPENIVHLLTYATQNNNFEMVEFMANITLGKNIDISGPLKNAITKDIGHINCNFYINIAVKVRINLSILITEMIYEYFSDRYIPANIITVKKLISFAESHQINIQAVITRSLWYSVHNVNILRYLVWKGADIKSQIENLLIKAKKYKFNKTITYLQSYTVTN